MNKEMESEQVQCPTPEAERTPKSPPRTPPSPQNSPPQEQEKAPSPTNDRAQSPEPNCAICLGKSQNVSFTDSCLHRFCFNCLLEWSKVKPECPLCKQSFKSIIHNVRSNEDYDQYHLNQNPSSYPWLEMLEMVQPRFRYRTTMVPEREDSYPRLRSSATVMASRRSRPRTPLEEAIQQMRQELQRHVTSGDVIPTQRTMRRRRGLASDNFRSSVYDQNLWVSSLPCLGMQREISPLNFRAHPEEVHRLIPWLNRELQAIVRCPSVAARVLDLVILQLPRYHMHSREFRYQLEPYLREHYDHFIHEFYIFARSPYDMIGFDENADYSSSRGNYWMEVVHDVPSDSDSDVVIVSGDSEAVANDESFDRPMSSRDTFPSAPAPQSFPPLPGPSRSTLLVEQPSDSEANNASSDTEAQRPCVDVDEEDACVIVGYVKPAHERTPEIITLTSSDTEIEEEITEVPQASHDHVMLSSFSSSSSSTSSNSSGSDSEYVPSSMRKYRKKTQRRKKTSPKSKADRKTSHSKKRDYPSSSDSSCSCISKLPSRRYKPSKRPSYDMSSLSSDSDSSWSHSRDRKRSYHIEMSMPGIRPCHSSYNPPYSPSEIDSFLTSAASSSCSSKPKLRSIVVPQKSSSRDKHRSSSLDHSKPKSSKKIKAEPIAGPSSSSSSYRRGGSQSSLSSHRRDSSSSRHLDRYKHVKKEEKDKKRKRKRRKSGSSVERRSHSKSKKRKRVLPMFSDSDD